MFFMVSLLVVAILCKAVLIVKQMVYCPDFETPVTEGGVGACKKPKNRTKNHAKPKNRSKFRSKPKTEHKIPNSEALTLIGASRF